MNKLDNIEQLRKDFEKLDLPNLAREYYTSTSNMKRVLKKNNITKFKINEENRQKYRGNIKINSGQYTWYWLSSNETGNRYNGYYSLKEMLELPEASDISYNGLHGRIHQILTGDSRFKSIWECITLSSDSTVKKKEKKRKPYGKPKEITLADVYCKQQNWALSFFRPAKTINTKHIIF